MGLIGTAFTTQNNFILFHNVDCGLCVCIYFFKKSQRCMIKVSAHIYCNHYIYFFRQWLEQEWIFLSIASAHFSELASMCQNYEQSKKTQHYEINHSLLCQIQTLLSKPTNPSSKCHPGDKIIPTGTIWIHFQISKNTLVYFIWNAAIFSFHIFF